MSQITKLSAIFLFSLCMALTGCGGGGGGGGDDGGGTDVSSGDGGDTGGSDDGGDTGGTDDPADEEPAEGAPTVTASSPGIKQLKLAWNQQEGDQRYVVSQKATTGAGFTEVAEIEGATETTMDISVHRYDGADTAFIVEACNADGCVPSAEVGVAEAMIDAIGYFKASNTDSGDEFGQSVALSEDGTVMAVGAHDEQSGTGEEADNSIRSAGAVYVFALTDAGWVQEAYIKADEGIAQDDDFGHSIALSADGSTLAIGAPWEEDTTQDPYDTGAVYVFTRSAEGVWQRQAYLHANPLRTSAHFGVGVSLSDDGNTMAVGAYGVEAGGTGEPGTDPGGTTGGEVANTGFVYIFTRTDGTWTQMDEIAAATVQANDMFGYDIALSGDASTLAVGAYLESSAATGVDGDDADTSAPGAGAVYIFGQGADGWEQQAYLKADTAMADAEFGYALAVTDDGNLLAVGGQGENEDAGAVYLFTRTDGVWAPLTRLAASNTEAHDSFGSDVALSEDGSLLAVGANSEDSPSQGTGGDETADTGANSGAVYIFAPVDAVWTQTGYVKAPNNQMHGHFGHGVALDATGDTLAVGAPGEDGASTGIDGDPANVFEQETTEGALNLVETGAGAVYLY